MLIAGDVADSLVPGIGATMDYIGVAFHGMATSHIDAFCHIAVNGTLYTVAKGTNFPQPTATDSTLVPLFHLVSLTAHTATISIAGGSYATGARTVTLKENKAVTLMNTADGTRYTLTLKPLGTTVAPGTPPTSPSGSPGSTPTTVTLPPATP